VRSSIGAAGQRQHNQVLTLEQAALPVALIALAAGLAKARNFD
jgi:hypothetical protein